MNSICCQTSEDSSDGWCFFIGPIPNGVLGVGRTFLNAHPARRRSGGRWDCPGRTGEGQGAAGAGVRPFGGRDCIPAHAASERRCTAYRRSALIGSLSLMRRSSDLGGTSWVERLRIRQRGWGDVTKGFKPLQNPCVKTPRRPEKSTHPGLLRFWRFGADLEAKK